MRHRRHWGAAVVATAFCAGTAVAQLLPTPEIRQPLITSSIAIPQPISAAPGMVANSLSPLSDAAAGVTTRAITSGTLSRIETPLLANAVSIGPQPPNVMSSTLAAPMAQPHLALTSGQAAADPDSVAAALESARKWRMQQLLRQEPSLLESDDQGNPVVRGRILVLNPDARLVSHLAAHGYRAAAELTDDRIGIRLVQLAVPRGLSAVQALRRLRALAPGVAADFDHIFEPAGAALGRIHPARLQSAQRGGLLIGMVDGGVANHPALAHKSIEQKGFAGELRGSAHGTAVASLLIGEKGPFRGAATRASLAVADVYGGRRASGSATTIVRGLGWLVSKRPAVINISLTGPPNLLLGTAIKAVQAKNIKVVAAVGNDGPAAPPQYPASYAGVIAVTGVDSRGRALVEASSANHVDFAAPAADMAAARPGGGYVRVRGTSFAAPLAAGRLALLGSTDRLAAEARPGIGRIGRGIVCSSCRTDPSRVGAR